MIKYEVRIFNVERPANSKKTVEDIWFNSADQDTILLRSFDSLEDARSYYDSISTECKYRHYGSSSLSYYNHSCKCIEMNEYDDDGEWVAGGDWLESDFGGIDDND